MRVGSVWVQGTECLEQPSSLFVKYSCEITLTLSGIINFQTIVHTTGGRRYFKSIQSRIIIHILTERAKTKICQFMHVPWKASSVIKFLRDFNLWHIILLTCMSQRRVSKLLNNKLIKSIDP